ncbi:MAG TPA: T9SS C-terminal target domain-containing protein, partial [Balneolaceae bacterium]|nr:T9SS C-terminal target domain-containing protein [Balneolaceae bacterium]
MRIATIVLVLMGLFTYPSIKAQSVISFAGGTLESSGMSLAFSAGEVVAGTFESPSMQLTGGFGNGLDLVYTSNENVKLDLPTRFDLSQNYPNP